MKYLPLLYVWGSIVIVCIGLFLIVDTKSDSPLVQDKLSLVRVLSNTPSHTPTVVKPATRNSIQIKTDKEQKKNTYSVRLVATGDVIPARSVNAQASKRNDFLWSWKNIAPFILDGDISLVNLEAPLVDGCQVTEDGMSFCGNVRHSDGLVYAGVDVVNFANNHSGNYSLEGIRQTVAALSLKGILVTGLGKTIYKEANGIRFAFLGYNDIGASVYPTSGAVESVIDQEVGNAKRDADVVVVSFHWGEEYVATPSARQIALAHRAVDAGADLIIGNHPHWIQPVETYKNAWITYAHGNTIFDQMWSEETKLGVIGIYTFTGTVLSDVSFVPTKIIEYGQPFILTDTKMHEFILDRLKGQ